MVISEVSLQIMLLCVYTATVGTHKALSVAVVTIAVVTGAGGTLGLGGSCGCFALMSVGLTSNMIRWFTFALALTVLLLYAIGGTRGTGVARRLVDVCGVVVLSGN